MATQSALYPWFGVTSGDDIEQGDILEGCPVFAPPDDLGFKPTEEPITATFSWTAQDVIVMTQSCDLVKGRDKGVNDVLLCQVWNRSELTGHLAKVEGLEDARKGRLPACHMLAASKLSGFERDVRIVDFRKIYSLPVAFVRNRAAMAERLRLLPPYREQLSQSFARFFMRVGLPIDIEPFKKK
jgi:hypothetical protein